MVVETRYAAGSGLLMGSRDHWLLLTDPGDEDVVGRLWTALTSADPVTQVLAVADEAFDDEVPALALVDVSTDLGPLAQRTFTRGAGAVRAQGAGFVLTLDGRGAEPTRVLLGGVVAADAAEVHRGASPSTPVPSAGPGATTAPAPAAGGLIDGIPMEILSAKGPDGPPPRTPRIRRQDPADSTARETTEPDPTLVARHSGAITEPVHEPAAPDPAVPEPATPEPLEPEPEHHTSEPGEPPAVATPVSGPDGHGDHDGSTVFRPDHLVATGMVETVDAVWCPAGHLTPPSAPLCRICRSQVAPQHPQRVPRPVLGGLRLATGEVVPLDRAVVLGRRPQPLPTPGEWPHLVTVPPDRGFVSRMHLHLAIEGWHLVARDLGSRGGTTLKVPGQAPVRMIPDQPYVLEPGHVLDLSDTYEVRYEVGPDVGASPAGGSSS